MRGRRPLRPTMDAAGVEHENVQSGRATTSDPQGLAPPQMSLEAPPPRRGAVADQAQPNARWGSSVRSPASSFGCSVLAETAGRRPKQHRRPAGGDGGVRRRKFYTGKKKRGNKTTVFAPDEKLPPSKIYWKKNKLHPSYNNLSNGCKLVQHFIKCSI